MEDGARWRLWAVDYFDQDSEASLEAEGEGILAGLEALWGRVLEEGVLDDGRATFTWFDLELEGGLSVAGTAPRSDTVGTRGDSGRLRTLARIPRDPLENPELSALRRWREEVGLIPALAQAHGNRLESGGAESVLEDVRSASSPLEVFRLLGID